jgi:hypothetical protein
MLGTPLSGEVSDYAEAAQGTFLDELEVACEPSAVVLK